MKIYRSIVREYDIECACLSVMLAAGCISEELFLDLKEADKNERNILVGKIQINNDELKNTIKNGIDKYVRKFIAKLENPDNVLEIAKDAVFIKSEFPNNEIIEDNISFSIKGEYYILIELPVPNSSTVLKIYKNREGVKVRYGTINPLHKAYNKFNTLIDLVVNFNTVEFYKHFLIFKKQMKGEDRLINTIDNNSLCDLVSELID